MANCLGHCADRWEEAEGLTEEKAAELMRTKWMDPAGGPERARPLDVILHGPPPPPRHALEAVAPAPPPPGLGTPAPSSLAIEDTSSRHEERTGAEPATATTSIPEPRQRDDLESKVADLQGAVERHDDLVRDYQKYCDELERNNQECFITISELTNEARQLRKEVDKHSGQLPMVFEDVVALKHQIAKLEQALAWLTSKDVEA